MRCPAQTGVNRSTTFTPVRTARVMRARCMAAGAALSTGKASSPCGRGPRPSTGAPRALIMRPFQAAQGESLKGPFSQTKAPRRISGSLAKVFTSTPRGESCTTCPPMVSWAVPLSISTTSPSMAKRDSPRTRQMAGEISFTRPPMRNNPPGEAMRDASLASKSSGCMAEAGALVSSQTPEVSGAEAGENVGEFTRLHLPGYARHPAWPFPPCPEPW